jgi:hypothetical protein
MDVFGHDTLSWPRAKAGFVSRQNLQVTLPMTLLNTCV